MKAAVVFPGQASQYTGMGKDLADHFPEAAAVFDEADGALGENFRGLLWEGPDETLNLTANTQPAVLTVSIAAWRVLSAKQPGLQPAFTAGHSLGEYSAHVAAETLSLADAIRTVRKRGAFMQEAVPVGEGAMAALMGMDAPDVEAVCRDAAEGRVVSPANDNAPGQIVIAGHADAVERAVELAKSRGCRRAVLLPVSAPFHSSLMKPAKEKLAPILDALDFKDPRWPVVANTDVKPVRTAREAREKLKAQVDSPVRWRETLLFLLESGVDTLVEVGPGKVLQGLAKRVSRDWKLLHVEDSKSLNETLEALP
ncbi:MAG: ACP S-malonyltransferase [Acidobacteriota bacterium]|jgi:[acyl-carrier-protein] S-malonyltransferase